MKTILTLFFLFLSVQAWAVDIPIPINADRGKGIIYSCSLSDFDKASRTTDGVVADCDNDQGTAYFVGMCQGFADDWFRQREETVAQRANLSEVFRNATTAQKCAAMIAIGIADPDAYLPTRENCP